MDGREKTLADMEDNLEKMKDLEVSAKMFCGKTAQLFIEVCKLNLEQVIKAEQSISA